MTHTRNTMTNQYTAPECPFCRHTSVIHRVTFWRRAHFFVCAKCGSSSPPAKTIDDAIDAQRIRASYVVGARPDAPSPCPYCGGSDIRTGHSFGHSTYRCRSCGATGPLQKGISLDVRVWNRRQAQDVYHP